MHLAMRSNISSIATTRQYDPTENIKDERDINHLQDNCQLNAPGNFPYVILLVMIKVRVLLRQFSQMAQGPGSLKEAKVYFPSRDDPECVEICYNDMECLAPEGYLTSTIMNFYMR
ncbi:hypothetical protein TSUD_186950 [Trifolium subterraneum]|uniref:Uncharacterized protein n=1 Tax=Trifolium subterraneum TaxID=3900 RepID=A0A2Z6PGG9_TRISU|nr:hypothetical protein TSUD_186950 [Trifolium subterraneum]